LTDNEQIKFVQHYVKPGINVYKFDGLASKHDSEAEFKMDKLNKLQQASLAKGKDGE
jgi:hypothetical protein